MWQESHSDARPWQGRYCVTNLWHSVTVLQTRDKLLQFTYTVTVTMLSLQSIVDEGCAETDEADAARGP